MKKAEELRKKSDNELVALCGELKKDLFDERNRRQLDKEAKTASQRVKAKREIARALTILRERELEAAGI